MKEILRSSTVMVTSIVVELEMMITVSPLLTSAPTVRVQAVTVPSMGATALKLARVFWASSNAFCAVAISSCLALIWSFSVSEPRVSRVCPAVTLA